LQSGNFALEFLQIHFPLTQACTSVHLSQSSVFLHSGNCSVGFGQEHSFFMQTCGDWQSEFCSQGCPLHSGKVACGSWQTHLPFSHFCLGGQSSDFLQGASQSGGVPASLMQTQRLFLHCWRGVHLSQPEGSGQLGGVPSPSVQTHFPFLRISFASRKIYFEKWITCPERK